MTYELVFVGHILGACLTALVGAYAIVALWNRFGAQYQLCAIVLGVLASFEIVSGTALSMLSLQISAASLCARVFLYLSLVALIELALFARLKKISLVAPVASVVSPIAASLAAFLSAIALGF